MAKTDGGPAFPCETIWSEREEREVPKLFSGMSLRDYLIASALTGLLANPAVLVEVGRRWPNDDEATGRYYVAAAFRTADAMLAERSKEASRGDR